MLIGDNYGLTVVIQAGGLSRRMGQDKALKEFLGEPLIQRLVKRLKSLGQEITVVARQPQQYAFLGLPVHTDIQPGVGALGGFYTALHFARTAFVAVVACDMPFANAELLLEAWQLLRENAFDAVVPIYKDKLQPFHAVYRVDTCFPSLQAALERGEQRVLAWLNDLNVHKISTQEIRKCDPLCMAFLNLNTPDDFESALRLARYYKR